MVAFSDSDYAGDPDTRRSVSGYVIYLCGVPISWRSKAQRSVTLSSTEAEWIALSEVAKEVLFMIQVLKSMGIELKTHLPDIKDGLLRAYIQSASTFPPFAIDYLNQRNAVNVEITSFRYRQQSYFFLLVWTLLLQFCPTIRFIKLQ